MTEPTHPSMPVAKLESELRNSKTKAEFYYQKTLEYEVILSALAAVASGQHHRIRWIEHSPEDDLQRIMVNDPNDQTIWREVVFSRDSDAGSLFASLDHPPEAGPAPPAGGADA
jgi:hypothetical protein